MLMLRRAPLYPPKSVSFEVGFSQNHMQPIPGQYQVQHTHHMQTFQLPASTSIGHFFKIILHGKVQQQFEDRQYYTAIRCVKVIGRCLPAAVMYDASQLVRSGQLPLTQILNMPAILCQQLQLQSMTVLSRYNAPLHVTAPKLPFLLLDNCATCRSVPLQSWSGAEWLVLQYVPHCARHSAGMQLRRQQIMLIQLTRLQGFMMSLVTCFLEEVLNCQCRARQQVLRFFAAQGPRCVANSFWTAVTLLGLCFVTQLTACNVCCPHAAAVTGYAIVLQQ